MTIILPLKFDCTVFHFPCLVCVAHACPITQRQPKTNTKPHQLSAQEVFDDRPSCRSMHTQLENTSNCRVRTRSSHKKNKGRFLRTNNDPRSAPWFLPNLKMQSDPWHQLALNFPFLGRTMPGLVYI
jgi:hypothetical protein